MHSFSISVGTVVIFEDFIVALSLFLFLAMFLLIPPV